MCKLKFVQPVSGLLTQSLYRMFTSIALCLSMVSIVYVILLLLELTENLVACFHYGMRRRTTNLQFDPYSTSIQNQYRASVRSIVRPISGPMYESGSLTDIFLLSFIYAIVNLIVLSFIGRQTFTSASHATRSRRSTTMGSSANSASKFAISLPSSYPGSPASARFDSSYPGSPASARFDEKELELNSITSPHLTIPVFQT